MKANTPARRFNYRALTSLTIAVGFLLLTLTGLILYVSPQGRVAHWVDWRSMGLDKEQWSAVHMNASVLFLAAAVLHLVYNWKPLLAYMKSKAKEGRQLRYEPLAALALGVLFVGGTVLELPPFATVVSVNAKIKTAWERGAAPAPSAHAEELTLDAFAKQIGMAPEVAMDKLRAAGVKVEGTSQKVREIAEANRMAPSAVHKALGATDSPAAQPTEGIGQGAGLGRLSLSDYCRREGLSLESAVGKLAERGIQADADSNLRDLADKGQTTPSELAALLR